MKEPNIVDLARLAWLQQRTLGMDPDHPVVKRVQSNLGLNAEQELWYTLLYLAYMHLPSAHYAFLQMPDPTRIRSLTDIPEHVLKLPTGFERRGLRVPANMLQHLGSLAWLRLTYGSFEGWLTHGFSHDRKANWLRLQENLQVAYQNGRWAAYNTGEVLMNNHGFSVLPGDMGMEGSSGPRWGLALLFGEVQGNNAQAITTLNAQAETLLKELNEQYDCGLRIDELETVLCDFHSMANGQHYVGHYPDLLQTQLSVADQNGYPTNALWAARDVLPDWSRGELYDWSGERKTLLVAYRNEGLVDWWRRYAGYPRPEWEGV